MKKHLFLLLFAIVASVSTTSAAITVRLDPQSCSSWSTVRLWAWTSAGNVFNAWPGEIVSTDTDGWYAYTFDESITEVSIIWNNGTAQTVDITGITASTCYALNSTSGTAITVRVVDCPSNPDPEPQTIDHVQIGSLYYNLNGTNRTAEVTYEERRVENNYAGLTSVNIPSSVTYNSYTYSVTSIGEDAFRDCSSLTSVTIGNSVTSIGYGAFENCSSLTSVTIPNSVTSIGAWAFYECSSLTSVTIPNSVTSIGGAAFYYCNITSINFLGTLADWCNKSWSTSQIARYNNYTLSINGVLQTDITIPNSVTSIGDEVFAYCSSLTSVTIGNSVTSIGGSAFGHCSSLTSVTIGNSVTSIGNWAFGYCSLTSITIPNSVTSIGEMAFSYCNITSINFWGTLADWCNKSWSTSQIAGYNNYYTLSINGVLQTDITIPNSVTSIGYGAFEYCSSLTSVTIPNSVTSIGEAAFRSCSGLTSVTIGNSVTSIGDYAFAGCSSLTSVTIPNSVTSIGYEAFYKCSSLTSVTIPNSVTSIGENAFYGCRITSINFLGTLADWCNKSWSTSQIAYSNNYTLSINGVLQTDITIPNSVTSIGDYAFYECSSLTSVTIPNSVTSIGEAAFRSCSSLTSVTMQSETPPALGNNVFGYGVSIYVPCGSLDEYRSADGWSNYASKIGYAPSPYTITTKAENGYIWYSKADERSEGLSICDETLALTAEPSRGFYFVKWADGNTDNPRTIELTQDITVEAIFDYLPTGKCGKDEALTWTFDAQTKALEITGAGELTDKYTYTYDAEAVTIGNEITIIGEDAFSGCDKIKNIIIGSSVKVIEHNAYSSCYEFASITCYSQRPPTVKEYAFNNDLPYSTIIYVPADYLATYKAHDFWGMYDVRPLGAVTVETSDVKVTPTETTADVVWPAVSGAATYELVIKDKNGNVICTLIFNANGQLTEIAFGAPGRDNSTQASGFSFTVTGLEAGTSYDLTITAKNDKGEVLQTTTQSFTTADVPTAVDNVNTGDTRLRKMLIDGQLLILRDGKTYTIQGVEVR